MAVFRVALAQFRHISINRSYLFEGEIVGRIFGKCTPATQQFITGFAEQSPGRHKESRSRSLHGGEGFKIDLEDEDEVASQLGAPSTDSNRRLYDEHIPTTVLQKRLLAAGSAFMSLYDPYRDDMIAVLGEVTGYYALQRLHDKMQDDPEGMQILNERPRINTKSVDMDWLASLPRGTLGREYVDFMKRNKISSDSRAPVHFVDNPDLAYAMQRYREIHDFNHALLGMPATMLGEVTVKWFEMINTGLPMTALGALFGPLRVKRKNIGKLMTLYIPWVVQTAPQAKLLLNVYFEKRWQQPLTELQDEIGIQPFIKDR